MYREEKEQDKTKVTKFEVACYQAILQAPILTDFSFLIKYSAQLLKCYNM